ncbi:MAG: peptide chain release factor N(5)-glutamine methyltransferase [Fibrobacter sp.]|nr:peptide chain release factor N(5)-glutamine methyltransferase [Fibrobacter sp.]
MLADKALKLLRDMLYPKFGDFALSQSEQILEYFLECSRSELYLNASKKKLDSNLFSRLEQIARRMILTDEPLGYILGTVYFYSREFNISKNVLIPRPDTEMLIEEILANETGSTCQFVDIGTGSGIIACILKESHPEWNAFGIDISYDALRVATKNSSEKINFLCGNIFSSLKVNNFFDFIVSNPPYISQKEFDSLDNSVRCHEPFCALYGGKDGLEFYHRLASESKSRLRENGRIYCEIGYDQKYSVTSIFEQNGWSDITIKYDIGKNPRVIRAVLK